MSENIQDTIKKLPEAAIAVNPKKEEEKKEEEENKTKFIPNDEKIPLIKHKLRRMKFKSGSVFSGNGIPCATGVLLDFDAKFEPQNYQEKIILLDEEIIPLQSALAQEIEKMGLRRPIIMCEMPPTEKSKLIVDGKPYKLNEKTNKDPTKRPSVRIALSCYDIVDLSEMNQGDGISFVGFNPLLPQSVLTKAANILLASHNQPVRVIPFPTQREEGGKTKYSFHLLPVSEQEFKDYTTCFNDHLKIHKDHDKAFYLASTLSFEFLKQRAGISRTMHLSDEQVDKLTITCRTLDKLELRGVIVVNSGLEHFESSNKRFNIHL